MGSTATLACIHPIGRHDVPCCRASGKSRATRETFRTFIETNPRYMDDLPSISRDPAGVSHDLQAVYEKCARGNSMTPPASCETFQRSFTTSARSCTTLRRYFHHLRRVSMNARKVSGLIPPLAIDHRSIAHHPGECSINPRRIERNASPLTADTPRVPRDAAVVARVALKVSRDMVAFVFIREVRTRVRGNAAPGAERHPRLES